MNWLTDQYNKYAGPAEPEPAAAAAAAAEGAGGAADGGGRWSVVAAGLAPEDEQEAGIRVPLGSPEEAALLAELKAEVERQADQIPGPPVRLLGACRHTHCNGHTLGAAATHCNDRAPGAAATHCHRRAG